jgi:predicted nucleic acid-binding protein
VLTSLPVAPRISPAIAHRLINENLFANAAIIELTIADYQKALFLATEKRFHGGVIFDVLIAVCLEKFSADVLLTFNYKDFIRIFSDQEDRVIVP